MNLIRILTLALIVWVIYRLITSYLQSRKQKTNTATTQPLVRCMQCGVMAADIVTDAQGNTYCSEAHRKLGPTQN